MTKRSISLLCFTLGCMFACQPVIGAPSGLNTIPTADVLDAGAISLELESAGPGVPWGARCDGVTLLQLGVGRGIELGLDRSNSGPDLWINYKWRIFGESGSRPALAIGTQAVTDDGRPQSYAVMSKTLGDGRVHLGIMDTEPGKRCLLGVDRPLTGRLAFQADYLNGREGTMTCGVAVCLDRGLSLTVARSIGNSADAGSGYIVNVAWSTALK